MTPNSDPGENSSSERVRPPVTTREQLLPFTQLTWENFENLCLRLARRGDEEPHCQRYGVPGQGQEGIDIYVRRADRKYDTWQCKRYREITPGTLAKAVAKFLAGEWADRTKRFYFVVSASLSSTELAKAVETAATTCAARGIEFIPLDSERLSEMLKSHPDLVGDFFGPAWNEVFSGIDETNAKAYLDMSNTVSALAIGQRDLGQNLDEKMDKMPEKVAERLISALASQLSQSAANRVETSFPADSLTKHLEKSFLRARDELLEGSCETARDLFGMLAETIEEGGIKGNEMLYFRVKSNLALSFVYLGVEKEAAKHFEESFPYSSGSIKGRTNLSLAARLRGEYEKSLQILEGILAEDKDNFEASYQQADLLTALDEREKALEIANRLQPTNTEERVRVGALFLCLYEFDRAKELVETAVESNSENVDAGVILADAIAFPIVQRQNDSRLPAAYLSAVERETLHRAIELYEKRLPHFRKSGNKDLARKLVNLSAFAAAAGAHEKGLAFAKEARELRGDTEDILRNIYVSAMPLECYDDAVDAATALAAFIGTGEALRLELEALSGARRFETGLERISQVRELAPEAANDLPIRLLEVRLTYEKPDTEHAEALLSSLITEFPEDGHTWLTAAEVAQSGRDPKREEEYRLKALNCELAPGGQAQCRARLGFIYGGRHDWLQALEFLSPLHGSLNESPFRGEIATCLFNLKRHGQAYTLTNTILSGGYNRGACEIAIQSAMADQHLDRAMKWAEFMRQHDGSVEALEYLAQLHARIGDAETAERLALRAEKDHPNDSRALILLSSIYRLRRKHKEAVATAIRALGCAIGDEAQTQAHRAVMAAGFGTPEDGPLSLEEMEAVRASISHLDTIKDPSLVRVEFGENFEGLKEQLREQMESANQGIEQYRKGMPIYLLCGMAGRDIYDVLHSLSAGGDLPIRISLGILEERQKESEIAASAKTVVLDVTALFTLSKLGQLGLLPRMFESILLPFPTYEALRRAQEESQFFANPAGQIRLVDDQLRYDKDSPTAREQEKQRFLASLIEFIDGNQIARTGFTKPAPLSEAGELMERLDKPAFAAMCIAHSEKAPLLCDDVGSRKLAELAFAVTGFSTQRLLEVARDRGLISKEDYHRCVMLLFENNYSFVSETPEDILFHLRQTGWAFDQITRLIFERFDKGGVNAARTFGAIMANAWMTADYAGKGKSAAWVEYILERFETSGDVVDNFKEAAYGVVSEMLRQPEAIFTLCRYVRSIKSARIEARKVFEMVIDSTAKTIETRDVKMDAPIRQRWEQCHRSHLAGTGQEPK